MAEGHSATLHLLDAGCNGSAPKNQQHASYETKPSSLRKHFFEQDVNRQCGNPEHIHDTECKEQRHEERAAAYAIRPMTNAHDPSTGGAVAPFGQKKAEWGSTLAKARVL